MHNDTIHFDAVAQDAPFCVDYRPVELVPPAQRRTFLGYVREDGQVGTRNCIAVIVCSNCAATVARKIADHFTRRCCGTIQMWMRWFPLSLPRAAVWRKPGLP